MSATEKKLPPDGGDKKGAPVDISRLSSGRLHPVPDECLGYEEESVYDYGIPEDVRGYEEDGSVHDKPRAAGGKKTPGEEESFAYKAKDLNECTWKPCLHGRCVNKDGGYNCICNPGWTGQNCQQDLNECDGNPCKHGRCVNKDGGYKCTCNPGWTGQNCQQDLNECTGNPCQHGRCVNKDGGYKCTCNPGWTGQNCQQDLNECTGNPCQHGRCVNKDGGYTCTCNPGWTGRSCHLGKPCPMGWSGYKNHCYKLMKDAATWEDAKKRCEQLGANLASITSYGEANFINTIITDAPVGKWGIYLVWFGLHRNDEFRKFTDGSQVFYTNWEPGQPNNNGNIFTGNEGQDCVGMYSKSGKGCGGYLFPLLHVQKGQWNDEQCYRPFPFICKRPK
ncbi:PREDICTED: neurocan core protein-like [Branchiostoma belcheri]|uniref:Neurocan core protein-like n=1 Tax=Branchiostoma belcheri TaxID=7741 RepID=A0A6P5AKW1_BRABE|nr:PREDICTED: neurocan core protein-like [Branchiostoma belcheri]